MKSRIKKYSALILLFAGISSSVQAEGVHPADVGQALAMYSTIICAGVVVAFVVFAISIGLRAPQGK